MNELDLNSVLKIYPNPEEVPDKPYFTRVFYPSQSERAIRRCKGIL